MAIGTTGTIDGIGDSIPGIDETWHVTSDGGSWGIVSLGGTIIASEMPFGSHADYIVALHNAGLDVRQAIEELEN